MLPPLTIVCCAHPGANYEVGGYDRQTCLVAGEEQIRLTCATLNITFETYLDQVFQVFRVRFARISANQHFVVVAAS
jgi:hypothetical protein